MTVRIDRARLRRAGERSESLELAEAAFGSIEPERLIRAAVSLDEKALFVDGERLTVDEEAVWVLAVGKASTPMARAAEDVLGSRLAGGIAIVPRGYGGDTTRIRVVEAGHPIPDEAGVAASEAVTRLATEARADDVVLCLLSGGGSALLASPAPDLSVEDLAVATGLLLASGATIDEINTVRRHLSTLQGGGLARLLHATRVRTLILSDVAGSRPESIASGPTVPDPTTFADAAEVLRQNRLWERVPPPVRAHIECGLRGMVRETAKLGEDAFNRSSACLLADNATFVEAICRAASTRGIAVLRERGPIVGEAREVGRELGRRAVSLASGARARTVLVGGGETTVTLRGAGRGGRNQELALAAALEIAGRAEITVLSISTDGADGPTDAAGAVVDGETVTAAHDGGLDPEEALASNDAYPLLTVTRDLLFTGPTRTNVADAVIVLIESTTGRSASIRRGRTSSS